MSLSKERIGQIALQALQQRLEQDGISLNPKTLKRQIHNDAKNFGITAQELAEFIKLIYRSAFDKTMAELESISPSSPSEKVAVNEDNT